MKQPRPAYPVLWRFAAHEGASSTVEFALVSWVFIGLCIGLIQFGMALQVRNDLMQAADRALRLVILDPEATDLVLEAQVAQLLPDYDEVVVDIGSETIASTDYRTITISYDLPFAILGIDATAMTLSAARKIPAPS